MCSFHEIAKSKEPGEARATRAEDVSKVEALIRPLKLTSQSLCRRLIPSLPCVDFTMGGVALAQSDQWGC